MADNGMKVRRFFPRISLERWSQIVTVAGFPLIFVSLVFAYIQISETRSAVSAQNLLAMDSAVFDSTNTAIFNDLYSHKPIRIVNKGKYTDADLDNLLGSFETIDRIYREGYLRESELCDSYSYYIELVYENNEIKSYLSDQESDGFFAGVDDLHTVINHSNDTDCH